MTTQNSSSPSGGDEVQVRSSVEDIVPEAAQRTSLRAKLKAWMEAWKKPTGAVAVVTVATLVVAATVATLAARSDYQMWVSSPHYFLVMSKFFVAVLGIRIIASRRLPDLSLLLDMVVVLLLMTALATAYTALKVQVPLINRANWDAGFAAVDRLLCLGIDPNVFLITIVKGGPSWFAQAIDTYYYAFVTMFVIFAAWFLTDPREEHRVAFATGWIMIWGLGAVLYVAFPSRGPVYFTRDLWREIAVTFPFAASLQAALLKNYVALVAGETRHIVHEYGIAAMPSLHVATHGYLWIWARGVGNRLAPLFLAMTTATWIASVATGWHWLVDGLVGLLLAWMAARLALFLMARSQREKMDSGSLTEAA